MQEFPMWLRVVLAVAVISGFIPFLVPGAPLVFHAASPIGSVTLAVALLWTREKNYRPLAILFFVVAAFGAFGLWQQLYG